MTFKYYITEHHKIDKDIGNYVTYGIKLENEQETEINDVSTDKSFVNNLVFQFNKYQLDPIHLSDAVEDSLTS